MPVTTSKIRKTIAFPEPVLEKISQKALSLGLSFVEYIRFLAIRDAENMVPSVSQKGEASISVAKAECASGNLKKYSSGKSLLTAVLS